MGKRPGGALPPWPLQGERSRGMRNRTRAITQTGVRLESMHL